MYSHTVAAIMLLIPLTNDSIKRSKNHTLSTVETVWLLLTMVHDSLKSNPSIQALALRFRALDMV